MNAFCIIQVLPAQEVIADVAFTSLTHTLKCHSESDALRGVFLAP